MTDLCRALLPIACLALNACSAALPIEGSTPKTGYGPLKDVVLLALTTQSLEGLLGHGLRQDGVTPDSACKVLRTRGRLSETNQHVTVIREASADAMVAAGYGPAHASVSTGAITHLAYIVEIKGYAEVDEDAVYRPESNCCFNGHAERDCLHGYVERVVRGSGVIKFLKAAHDEGGLRATELFETKAGQSYRVLDEYRFDNAYFGFVRGDSERLCRGQSDVASFEPTHVAATPNCSIMAYDIEGTAKHLAKYLPDLEACKTVGVHFCQGTSDCVRCIGSYQHNEQ